MDHGSREKRFEAFERGNDLFAFTVDGWSAWRVLRNPVQRLAIGPRVAPLARSDALRSLRAIISTFKLLWLLVAGGRRELLVKTSRSGLRMREGERYRDVYFDGVLQRGHSCLKLEETNSPDFARQASAAVLPSDLDPVVFTFWGRVLGRLFPLREAGAFCDRVAHLVAQEIDVTVAGPWLLMRLSTVYWQIRLYSVLLGRVRPSAVLVADTGEYALRIACHRRGIRFIELQHGVFDAKHPDAVPLWCHGTPTELILPDVLACRGEYWIEQLASTRQGRDHAVAVGNELIDLARERRHLRASQGPLRLVLTSQGVDSSRLASWISEMTVAAPAGLDWRLTIKLHPVNDVRTHDYDALASDARIIIVGGAEQPNVFDLLADADVHLSIASACHFDAAALGVPTVVVPLKGHEPMLEAVDDNQFFLASNPAALWAVAQWPPIDGSRAHRFATPGFVDNFERIIQ